MRERTAAILRPYRAPAIRTVLQGAVTADVGLWPLLSGNVGYIAPAGVPPRLEQTIHCHRHALAQVLSPGRLRYLWAYPSGVPLGPRFATLLAWLTCEAVAFTARERAQWRVGRTTRPEVGMTPHMREFAAVVAVVAGRYDAVLQAAVPRTPTGTAA